MQYRLGDKVRIRVEAVHLAQKMVDFSLVGSERKPRRAGKTAKTRAKKVFKELPPNTSKRGKSATKKKAAPKKSVRKPA